MLDPRLIRNELETTAEQLARRGLQLDCEQISSLESRRKELQVAAEQLFSPALK
jgi:seryl-tRNA synthetase